MPAWALVASAWRACDWRGAVCEPGLLVWGLDAPGIGRMPGVFPVISNLRLEISEEVGKWTGTDAERRGHVPSHLIKPINTKKFKIMAGRKAKGVVPSGNEIETLAVLHRSLLEPLQQPGVDSA